MGISFSGIKSSGIFNVIKQRTEFLYPFTVGTYGRLAYSSWMNTYINNFTISAWVKPTDLTVAISRWDINVQHTFNLMINSTSITFNHHTGTTYANPLAVSVNTSPMGIWNHVVVTKSSTEGMKLYMNGNPTPVATNASGTTSLTTSYIGELRIGSLTNGAGTIVGSTGRIKHVNWVNRVITNSEISMLYTNPSTVLPTSIVSYAMHDQTSIFADASGNNRNMTIVSPTSWVFE